MQWKVDIIWHHDYIYSLYSLLHMRFQGQPITKSTTARVSPRPQTQFEGRYSAFKPLVKFWQTPLETNGERENIRK